MLSNSQTGQEPQIKQDGIVKYFIETKQQGSRQTYGQQIHFQSPIPHTKRVQPLGDAHEEVSHSSGELTQWLYNLGFSSSIKVYSSFLGVGIGLSIDSPLLLFGFVLDSSPSRV